MVHGLTAISAVSPARIVKGDKQTPELTKQFNEGHVTDIVEIGGGDLGEDICDEVKCLSSLKKKSSEGRGSTDGGGAPASVGHIYPTDGPMCHKTGKGWVKGRRGCYADALLKKNKVDILVHEDLGGGFCPVGAKKMRKMGREAARTGVDRTKYTHRYRRRLSYVQHHTQRISLAIVRENSIAIHDREHRVGVCRVLQVGAYEAPRLHAGTPSRSRVR